MGGVVIGGMIVFGGVVVGDVTGEVVVCSCPGVVSAVSPVGVFDRSDSSWASPSATTAGGSPPDAHHSMMPDAPINSTQAMLAIKATGVLDFFGAEGVIAWADAGAPTPVDAGEAVVPTGIAFPAGTCPIGIEPPAMGAAVPMGTPATGTPAVGTPVTGTPAVGTPATGTPAVGTPVTGAPAVGTPATGTPPIGTPLMG